MKSFKEHLQEDLITFSKKSYPKFGNIVILAGGAGSGKGFILKNLIGMEGKVLDVDDIKVKSLNSVNLANRIQKETGVDIRKLNLKNPTDVSKLHVLLKKVIATIKSDFIRSVGNAHPDRLPNIIFDVTLSDWKKFIELEKTAELLGYNKENIHLVWVVNSVNVAKQQNQKRARVVPEKILVDTHVGAARTFKDIINLGSALGSHINGDIWVAFNNAQEKDVTLKTSDKGGKFVATSNKIKLKDAGKSSINKISQNHIDRLFKYTGQQF